MNNNKRRWKDRADTAVSPAHFVGERDRVALEVGAHIAGWGAPSGNVLQDLQGRVLSLVEDSWVHASLAARHLDTLHDSLQSADYEDVHALKEELAWTEAYLAPTLDGFVARRGDRKEGYTDRLYRALATTVAPRFEIAPAA